MNHYDLEGGIYFKQVFNQGLVLLDWSIDYIAKDQLHSKFKKSNHPLKEETVDGGSKTKKHLKVPDSRNKMCPQKHQLSSPP